MASSSALRDEQQDDCSHRRDEDVSVSAHESNQFIERFPSAYVKIHKDRANSPTA